MYLKSVGGNSLSASRLVSQRDLTIHSLFLPMERGDGCRQKRLKFTSRLTLVCVCVLNITLTVIHTVSQAVVKYCF